MITVLMIAYNEIENVKMSVESFRLFCDVEISLVIVDNGSEDGLWDWAKEQLDITYVRTDERPMSCGKALNLVRKELEIDTDLLVIECRYMITPQYLSRMREMLYSEENVGAVAGIVCNTPQFNPNRPVCIQNYEEAIRISDKEERAKGKYALMVRDDCAVLWKKEVLKEIGDFEETVNSVDTMICDYCIRTILTKQKIMICLNAFLWQMNVRGPMGMADLGNKGGWNALEKKWGMHYFNDIYNPQLIEMIERGTKDVFSVLEIGCDCGATLLEVKNRFPNVQVYGCDINVAAIAIASQVADAVVNNIEERNLPFPKGNFDYIIFGDVLEHLHNPMETLVYCKGFLKAGGAIIASIPNLMHISVIEKLLQGDFTYAETGLLDKTHIHMFTFNEIVRMFDCVGLQISRLATSLTAISDRQRALIDNLLVLEDKAQRFMYETFQFAVRAE
ncbi:ubiquinone biosynthesis O-methyltransferase [Lachnospiraceae bacterium]|nr:ubiquinone biosynthesis O-methyltransferase [Lachnospiraceae bacterium]